MSETLSTTIFVGGIDTRTPDCTILQCLVNLKLYVGKITRFQKKRFAFVDVVAFSEIPYGEYEGLRVCKYRPRNRVVQNDEGSVNVDNRLQELESQMRELRILLEKSNQEIQSAFSTLRSDLITNVGIIQGDEKLGGSSECLFQGESSSQLDDSVESLSLKPSDDDEVCGQLSVTQTKHIEQVSTSSSDKPVKSILFEADLSQSTKRDVCCEDTPRQMYAPGNLITDIGKQNVEEHCKEPVKSIFLKSAPSYLTQRSVFNEDTPRQMYAPGKQNTEIEKSDDEECSQTDSELAEELRNNLERAKQFFANFRSSTLA